MSAKAPAIKRRSFLALTGLAALGALARPRGARAADRAAQWPPSTRPLLGIEWRYLAGRITAGVQDVGFVVSVGDVRVLGTKELLVERYDFGAGTFVHNTYTGTLAYDAATRTYTFQTAPGADSQATATWQLDTAANVYRLSVAAPELTLAQLVLEPQGALIAEGGNGLVNVGSASGVSIASDYYADWVTIRSDGAAVGVARLDMQALYPGAALHAAQRSATDYDHHWFALAAEHDGAPLWLSAWRIETGGPLWGATVARGGGAAWQTSAYSERSVAVQPLAVQPLAFQPLPALAVAANLGAYTGTAWRISAGISAPGDLLDLTLAAPPGQFIVSSRLALLGGPNVMLEAIGTTASGTVLGRPIQNVRLVVAETTAEFDLRALPLVLR